MPKDYALIGAPTSAGAYAPGQEKAPDAIREAGLITRLKEKGASCSDYGNTRRFRWRADRARPRAMNLDAAIAVAKDVEDRVADAYSAGRTPIVIGGDCTVELGTVSAAALHSNSVGLVYIDGDADMRTPETTTDGALDWMGVAHMLALPGTARELAEFGARTPLLAPGDILLFGVFNVKPDEQACIARNEIAVVDKEAVRSNPSGSARETAAWGRRFDKLLIHLDVDVIDFEESPLAENTRRKRGLPFDRIIEALSPLVRAPNFAGLTICEINPDHGAEDGSTMERFVAAVSTVLAAGDAGA